MRAPVKKIRGIAFLLVTVSVTLILFSLFSTRTNTNVKVDSSDRTPVKDYEREEDDIGPGFNEDGGPLFRRHF